MGDDDHWFGCFCCNTASGGPASDLHGQHVHGSCDRNGYELRSQVDERGRLVLDEVVARNATVHLEQMNDDDWYLGIYLPDGNEIRVSIARSGKRVYAQVYDLTGPKAREERGDG